MKYLPYLLAASIGLIFWSGGIFDPDLGWHLVGGDWIRANWAVPSKDFINALNDNWRDYHWLFQLGASLVYSLGGLKLLQFTFGILAAVIFALGTKLICQAAPRVRLNIITVLFIFLLSSALLPIASVRPQMFAILLISIALTFLNRTETKYETPLLYLICAVLANVHIYWVFIPLLFFIHRTLPAILGRQNSVLRHCVSCLAIISAAVVSPYGEQNYEILWEYIFLAKIYRANITELQSVFYIWNAQASLVAFAAVVLLLDLRRKNLKHNLGARCAAGLGIILSVFSIKFLGIFAVTTLPYVYRLAIIRARILTPNLLKQLKLSALLIFSLSICYVYKAALTFPYSTKTSPESALEVMFPITACRQLVASSQSAPPAIVATYFDDGGWCKWAMSQAGENTTRVTSDGRTQDSLPEHFRQTIELYAASPGWQGTIKAWAANAVVVGINQKLYGAISQDNSWLKTYQDKNFAMFVRHSGV